MTERPQARTVDDGLYDTVSTVSDLFPAGHEPKKPVQDKLDEDRRISAALLPAAEIIAGVVKAEIDKLYDLRDLRKKLTKFNDPTGELMLREIDLRERNEEFIKNFAVLVGKALQKGLKDE
jgi:hypothetical protein